MTTLEAIVIVVTGVLGINVVALLRMAYVAGQQTQRLEHLERQMTRLLAACPYCQIGPKHD
jgi:hypothetical protein